MGRARQLASVVLVVALLPALPAGAQDVPAGTAPAPTGPADLIRRATNQPVAQTAPQMPEPGPQEAQPTPDALAPIDPHAMMGGGPADLPHAAQSVANPSMNVPVGSIRVSVVDATFHGVRGATVDIGVMGQEGRRDRMSKPTDERGIATFDHLDVGTGQAYRVNVPFNGATFSSTPFQLPPDHGYDVRIVRTETTQSDTAILLGLAQIAIELRDERLHVTEQLRFVNRGQRTYVFPASGRLVPLPHRFTAVQLDPSMTDQHLTEMSDRGVRITGSLPPGQVDVAWAFDVPIPGADTVELNLEIPFRAYIVEVITEVVTGLSLHVDGMPEPRAIEDNGRRLLATGIERPDQTRPYGELRVRLAGIPVPGPGRWIVVVLASVVMLTGLYFGFVGGKTAAGAATARDARRRMLLGEVADLERQRSAGDIGPKYHQRRIDAITLELAGLLREDAQQKKSPSERAAR